MTQRRIRYEPMQSKTVLNAVKAPSMPFEWSINPYRGCQHGCSFCYARATHAFLGVEADDTFQNRIFVKTNAPEALREQLRKLVRSKKGLRGIGRIAIGTATDPYQPIEAKAMLTRRCLEVLAEYPVPVSITTRSPLILRDLDLLRRIPDVSVNMSIGTLDPDVWRNFEPSTPSPEKRLDTVRRLTEEGIPAAIFMAPLLPYLSDGPEQLAALVAKAAESRPRFVMTSFLRLNKPEVKLWFFRVLNDKYPHLTETYASLYRGSAYAPPSYREPVQQLIKQLLTQHGLNDAESFRTAGPQPNIRTSVPDQAPEPVQQLYLF